MSPVLLSSDSSRVPWAAKIRYPSRHGIVSLAYIHKQLDISKSVKIAYMYALEISVQITTYKSHFSWPDLPSRLKWLKWPRTECKALRIWEAVSHTSSAHVIAHLFHAVVHCVRRAITEHFINLQQAQVWQNVSFKKGLQTRRSTHADLQPKHDLPDYESSSEDRYNIRALVLC